MKGAPAADIARVRMPVGADIGARTPAEIGVAIAAEIVAWRAGHARARWEPAKDADAAAPRNKSESESENENENESENESGSAPEEIAPETEPNAAKLEGNDPQAEAPEPIYAGPAGP
jgi:hypothetical protein